VTALLVNLSLAGFDNIRASIQGSTVVLEGCVASFDAKCKIERIAAKAGLRVRNRLRVTPAAFIVFPLPEAS
jgi:hypothetical protein